MGSVRNIFIVVAGGNAAAERHFEDTIKTKRTLDEVRQFLPQQEINNLENVYHNSPFIVWGSVPGPLNETRWNKMKPGDIVLINNKGRIRFVGEVAAKVRNKDLAKYFWRETSGGDTWELMYFIVNEETTNVPLNKLNPLFGYSENYSPRGFTMIDTKKVEKFARHYGDILGVLKTFEKGEAIKEVRELNIEKTERVTEKIERAPTEHDEMQWRLIRLGTHANLDVWVPKNDQGKQYEGHRFREFVIPEFHETLDVPPTIKNIDVVWKFGPYSIKSAFEIENTTAVYSGILRLADLRAENPNSNYPLFIVAPSAKKTKVFNELSRASFSEQGLKMNEIVRYLDYDIIRDLDESVHYGNRFDSNILISKGEMVG